MGKTSIAGAATGEHYSCRVSMKLSKNYNSVEGSVEYGRDRKSGETDEEFFDNVETVAFERLQSTITELDKALTGRK